ncbi:CHAP domain-containing protein [Gordonia sp. ABSL1-1]|uniref:CHAP domain-containing protein n=1 Tax=Gordonia sp. ABSL1-1 TaxID=3053923 RepID=UPI0025736055|nr:CHAP domain-containing protein [Gordonia sp. ABSL1-1]MDL9935585.1 CHAP domain-containing protein [Gordonia sp. ABSL1-1]
MSETCRPRRRLHRVVSAIAVAAAIGGMTTAFADQADAGIKSAKTLQVLNVRSAPSASGQLLRQLPANVQVGINCWTNGQAVTGKYGTTTIWYTVDGGGWVTDAGLYTGTNNPVTPKCGGAPTPPPATSGRKVGAKSGANTGMRGQCTWGAMELWRQATGYYPAIRGNAKDWADSARANGWTVVLDAQPRSIVVFAPGVHGVDRTYGHVAWVKSVERRGDGLYIHYRDMNHDGRGTGTWYDGVTKDIRGMSYILAP